MSFHKNLFKSKSMQLCVYVKLSILLNAQLNKAFKAFRFSSGQSINVLQMGKKMFA